MEDELADALSELIKEESTELDFKPSEWEESEELRVE